MYSSIIVKQRSLLLIGILTLFSKSVLSHEMAPTYIKFVPSHINNVYKTSITLSNKRKDNNYYEINVFDKNWNKVNFVSGEKIMYLPYLSKKSVNIFVKDIDVNKVTYVCSLSRLLKSKSKDAALESKICSKRYD
jgi:hypothetical protein